MMGRPMYGAPPQMAPQNHSGGMGRPVFFAQPPQFNSQPAPMFANPQQNNFLTTPTAPQPQMAMPNQMQNLPAYQGLQNQFNLQPPQQMQPPIPMGGQQGLGMLGNALLQNGGLGGAAGRPMPTLVR